MSNEFSKFVAGVRVRAWHAIPLILGKAEDDARAADSPSDTDGIAWRGSPARILRARRLRAKI
jgi:hypothetical protein